MPFFSSWRRMRRGLVVALAAFLVFAIQPIAARRHLPLLGGSSQVWNGCMLFFQTCLLVGYAWAHWGARRLGRRRHGVLHLLLLMGALALFGLHEGTTTHPQSRTSRLS